MRTALIVVVALCIIGVYFVYRRQAHQTARRAASPSAAEDSSRLQNVDRATLEMKVVYSTPFGDTTDGGQKLFVVHASGTSYYPVFRNADGLKAYFEKERRANYLMMQGDVASVISTMRSIATMHDMGIVIDPLSPRPTYINSADF